MKFHHKYWLQYSVLVVLYSIIAALLLHFCPPVLGMVLALATAFLLGWLGRLLASRKLIGILNKELNAQKFYDIICQKPSFYHISYRLNAERCMGNYKNVIALSTAGLNGMSNVHWKAIFLTYLAIAYFEIRDHENLAKTVDAFYELPKYTKKLQKFLAKYSAFQFYKAYLDKDFEQCIALTEDKAAKVRKNHPTKNLDQLAYQRNFAIVYYELGEFEKAKEIFRHLMEAAPNLNNFYELSARYITAIEQNGSPDLMLQVGQEEITQTERELFSLQKKAKKENIVAKLATAVICFLVGFLVLTSIAYGESYADYKARLAEYEADLNDALSLQYDSDAKFIEYFNVMNGENVLEVFCLVEVDGRLDLTSVVTRDQGVTSNLVLLLEDVKIPGEYTVESAVSVYKITFYISDERLSESEYQQIVKYSHNGANYWFGIKDVFSAAPTGTDF
ncbi:MAG: hypothetical protein IKC31_03395 [Clostridia bacterium]|nr:hypothetical protein [Clostridia bacterium]